MTAVLSLAAIGKRFGAVTALHDASLAVRAGTVHALLGENGAGKTTLMRIAYGMHRPDGGTLAFDGRAVTLRTPADAIARGVGMVHQHFSLVPTLTVAESVALGMHGAYTAARAAARVHALGERTGLLLHPAARVEELSVREQQRLEIMKALAREARVLILDEPTAVLAPLEAEDLLRWVRQYCERGNAAVLITHKLREALRWADEVTVLRHGRTVAAGPVHDFDDASLVRALLGEEQATKTYDTPVAPLRDVVLATEDVSVDVRRATHPLHDVTLSVRGGEIVGLAAVEGSGQHALLRVLAGQLTPTRGTVVRPDDIAFIPEDRHRDALALDLSLTENVALRGLHERRGRMPWNVLRRETTALMQRFDVRAAGSEISARALSGGNQQKLIVGRELQGGPAAVIAENPTRGLDLRASASVHDQLRHARDGGAAVFFYSSDLEEILAVADRVLVLHAGQLIAVEKTRDAVGRAMLGAH